MSPNEAKPPDESGEGTAKQLLGLAAGSGKPPSTVQAKTKNKKGGKSATKKTRN